jgi:hypothetical protein
VGGWRRGSGAQVGKKVVRGGEVTTVTGAVEYSQNRVGGGHTQHPGQVWWGGWLGVHRGNARHKWGWGFIT